MKLFLSTTSGLTADPLLDPIKRPQMFLTRRAGVLDGLVGVSGRDGKRGHFGGVPAPFGRCCDGWREKLQL